MQNNKDFNKYKPQVVTSCSQVPACCSNIYNLDYYSCTNNTDGMTQIAEYDNPTCLIRSKS